MILDVARCYLWLFSLYINIKIGKIVVKGRSLLFQVYRNFANLFFKLSVSTFYKEISKFQHKVQN